HHHHHQYASVERNGIHYMTPRDFICKFLVYDEDTIMLLANVVDTTNDGLISFNEFQAFEGCLVQPDSIYALAFRIFDKNSNGYISFDEFFDVLCKTELHKRIPFDFDSSFILLHFGKDKKKLVSYSEFTKILHDFYEEHALQAFMKYDERMEGFITANQFNDVMLSLKSHLLTDYARDNLLQVVSGGTKKLHSKHISYSYFTAFISLLNNMELIKQIYISGAKNNLEAGLTREELLHEAQKYTQVTPLEIDILFQLISVKNQTGLVEWMRLVSLDGLILLKGLKVNIGKTKVMVSGEGRGILIQIMESAYRFTLGSVAGATGATAVYPIDLVKTRLQNQRTASYIGERMYKNSFDCFKKVLRHEGFFGLYRGLLPQIVGVAPEKAIKLTVNDFVRDKTTSADGKIPLWGEIMAGCSAGACQVIFTNPLEIVKIRLQVAGEIATSRKLGAIEVVKDLGYLGLYKVFLAGFIYLGHI
ncbi:hypothetical protein HELRODRAFT_77826, partial [Helobdella robusta]|uniref:EF-hand domain-containing protein n=1 Tax=Helobdella robusta TaxID=6412 RepID=T1G347_HELRO